MNIKIRMICMTLLFVAFLTACGADKQPVNRDAKEVKEEKVAEKETSNDKSLGKYINKKTKKIEQAIEKYSKVETTKGTFGEKLGDNNFDIGIRFNDEEYYMNGRIVYYESANKYGFEKDYDENYVFETNLETNFMGYDFFPKGLSDSDDCYIQVTPVGLALDSFEYDDSFEVTYRDIIDNEADCTFLVNNKEINIKDPESFIEDISNLYGAGINTDASKIGYTVEGIKLGELGVSSLVNKEGEDNDQGIGVRITTDPLDDGAYVEYQYTELYYNEEHRKTYKGIEGYKFINVFFRYKKAE